MTNKSSRDSLFPATSIGRTSGSRFLSTGSTGTNASSTNATHTLSRTPSHESLIAHPLLSPSSTGNGASTSTSSSSTTGSNSTAWDNGYGASNSSFGTGGGSNTIGYVPYTPRHRPPLHSHSHPTGSTASSSLLVTPATTSMSTVPPSSQHAQAQGDATSKLQLMNLKSAAQGLGLDMGSIGWAIVEALVGIGASVEDEETEVEWKEAWEALNNGKATLLLPLEPLSHLPHTPRSANNDKQKQDKDSKKAVVTPAFVKNHIVFCEPPNLMSGKGKDPMKVVTLSGFRGVIEDQSVTITSTLHPSTKAFQDISSPGTRASGFATLFPSTTPFSPHFPRYILPSYNPSLSLPPRGSLHVPTQNKPPLPPRRPPGASSTSPSAGATLGPPSRPTTPQGGTTGSRLSSLASLFGHRSSPQPQPNTQSQSQTNQTGAGIGSSSPLVGTQPLPLGIESGGGTNSSRPPSILSVSETGSVASVEGVVSPTHNPANQVSISVGAYTIQECLIEQKLLEGIWKGIVEGELPVLLKRSISHTHNPDDDASETAAKGEEEEDVDLQGWLALKAVDFLEKQKALPVLRVGSLTSKINRPKIAKRLASATSGGSEIDTKGVKGGEGNLVYEYAINEYGDKEGFDDIEDLGARYQEFYADLEDEVRERRRMELESQEEREEKEKEVEGAEEDEKRDPEAEADKEDRRVREIMERVEHVCCSAGGVYERLFSSPSSCVSATAPEITANEDVGDGEDSVDPTLATDAAHDEALSSRIAALTMVEFSLGDLDIDVGGLKEGTQEEKEAERKKREEGVLSVVEACGKTLAQLETAYTPAEKAGVLVKAHKALVDGLTKLPPIRLKAEVESAQNTPIVRDHQNSTSLEDAEDIEDGPPTARPQITVQMEETKTGPAQPAEEREARVISDALQVTSPVSLVVTPAETSATPPADATSIPSPTPATQPTPTSPNSPSEAAFSLDTIFPLLILSVVKTNPPNLISHLLYIQRFRNRSFGGEEAYCLVNLMAVAEFIGALDPSTITSTRLGLFPIPDGAETPSGPVPIPIPIGGRQSLPPSRRGSLSALSLRSAGTGSTAVNTLGHTSQSVPTSSSSSTAAASFTLRHRVEQQVDALSTSANKVLTGVTGVVDSSFGIFRSMSLNGVTLNGLLALPNSPEPVTPAINSAQAAAPWNGYGRGGGGAAAAAGVNGAGGGTGGATSGGGSGGTGAGAGDGIAENSKPVDAPSIGRKESGFSIKGIKLPGMGIPGIPTIGGRGTKEKEKEEEMISVSRPGSVRSRRSLGSRFGGETSEDDDDEEVSSSLEGEEGEEDDDEDDEEESYDDDDEDGDEEPEVEAGASAADEDEGSEDEEDSDDDGESYLRSGAASDSRSIKSFESMMSSRRAASLRETSKSKAKSKTKTKARTKTARNVADAARKSLSDRLARVSSGLGGGSRKGNTAGSGTGKTLSPPNSRRSSLLVTNTTTLPNRFDTPVSSRPQSPAIPSVLPLPLPQTQAQAQAQAPHPPRLRLPPPNKRFLECTSADDLKIGEVGELLREYKRLVDGVRAVGGFVESGEDG